MQPTSTETTMDIHVFANNQQMGPFSKETVLQMASIGSLPADASVCFTLLTCAPVLVMRPLSPWVWLSAAFGAFNAWRAVAQ